MDPEPVAPGPAEARQRPSLLLLPRHRIVPFSGREGELDELGRWLDGPEAMSVRLLHAPGGQGKTRLALHFAGAAAARGWTVWQAHHRATPGPADHLPWDDRLLVVVDYAERWPAEDLYALLNDLSNLGLGTGTTVRVLLLSRSAGFWWSALVTRLDSELTVPAHGQALRPLGHEPLDRAELFRTAAERFATALGLPGTATPVPPATLDAPDFAQILSVHMAALVAVDDGGEAPGEVHRLSARLLHREAAYWHLLPGGSDPYDLSRTVYVATLIGAMDPAAARKAVSTAEISDTSPVTLLSRHAACYPPERPGTVLEALHPDRLGEDLIGLMTPGETTPGETTPGETTPGETTPGGTTPRGTTPTTTSDFEPDVWAPAAVSRLLGTGAPPAWTAPTMAVLVETALRWQHIAQSVLLPLIRARPDLLLAAGGATIGRFAEVPWVDLETLELVDRRIPVGVADLEVGAAALSERLTALRLTTASSDLDRALVLARHGERLDGAGLHEHARQAWEEALNVGGSALPAPTRIRLVRDISTVLSSLGRSEEALQRAQEAADLRRSLIRAEGLAPHAAGVAVDLRVLGNALAAVGRAREGIDFLKMALSAADELATADPDRHALLRISILQDVGSHLIARGRPGDAVLAIEATIDARRWLVGRNPGAHSAGLARALSDLGTARALAGRTRDAVAATDEAVALYRRLVEANPAAYRPMLSNALTNHCIVLELVGRLREAAEPGGEAADIRRELAAGNPSAHLPGLAVALLNYSARLAAAGRSREALGPAEECVAICRVLADARPAAHRPRLAEALVSLANVHLGLGRPAEGLAMVTEGAELWRRLAGQDFVAHGADFAKALNNLATLRSGLGLRSEALAAVEESVAAYRRLADAQPEAHRPALAMALNNLGTYLGEVGRDEDALAAAEESVTIRRSLDPAALATSLLNLGLRLSRVGREADATSAGLEAVAIFRELAEADPGTHLPALALALHNVGMSEEPAAREAVAIRRRLAGALPERHGADLAASLFLLGMIESDNRRPAEAFAAIRESVDLYREAARLNPRGHGDGLANALNGYAELCATTGQDLPAGVDACVEAIGIWEEYFDAHPDAFGPKMRLVHTTLGRLLDALGDHETAQELRDWMNGHGPGVLPGPRHEKRAIARNSPRRW
ncbi:tetratricopeptide repeat protein [Actinoplanes sp. RD1]|uniref:tetratricopeptide repeat protein n=1 Tax=Actinoplanes sp. RD1 TaxID=3064538 RepID=UPI0027424F23|nr:tetratricopeptide repeat protein [Actinoplanes sp. RD1]